MDDIAYLSGLQALKYAEFLGLLSFRIEGCVVFLWRIIILWQIKVFWRRLDVLELQRRKEAGDRIHNYGSKDDWLTGIRFVGLRKGKQLALRGFSFPSTLLLTELLHIDSLQGSQLLGSIYE